MLRLYSVRDFAFSYTVESAQPLTFYSDYEVRSGAISFPYKDSMVSLKYKSSDSKGAFYLVGGAGGSGFGSKELSKLFRLEDNMDNIYGKISTDAFMKSSVEKYRGMRLTHNDPWITTLVFIISQFNNIKRIRRIVKTLMEKYGDAIYDGDKVVGKAFPRMETLSRLSVKELMACGAGFRADYIREASRYCSENLDLYRLGSKDYDTIKSELMQVRGIGDKVADCIALMGYGKLEAFPIDTWVKRVVERVYFKGKKKSIKEIHTFAEDRWGGLAGYAQQYLYWHGMHSL